METDKITWNKYFTNTGEGFKGAKAIVCQVKKAKENGGIDTEEEDSPLVKLLKTTGPIRLIRTHVFLYLITFIFFLISSVIDEKLFLGLLVSFMLLSIIIGYGSDYGIFKRILLSPVILLYSLANTLSSFTPFSNPEEGSIYAFKRKTHEDNGGSGKEYFKALRVSPIKFLLKKYWYLFLLNLVMLLMFFYSYPVFALVSMGLFGLLIKIMNPYDTVARIVKVNMILITTMVLSGLIGLYLLFSSALGGDSSSASQALFYSVFLPFSIHYCFSIFSKYKVVYAIGIKSEDEVFTANYFVWHDEYGEQDSPIL